MKTGLIPQLASVCLSPCVAVAEDDSKAKATYQSLVEKGKSGDKSVDFKQLRLSYSDHRRGPDVESQKKAMFAALRSGKFAEAIKNADRSSTAIIVDMDAHVVETIANMN